MTKNELIKELAVSGHLTITTASQAVDGALRIIKEALAKGEEVSIRDFGVFTPRYREARTGIDFVTRQPITIPAQTIVKFRPYKELKNLLNNGSVD